MQQPRLFRSTEIRRKEQSSLRVCYVPLVVMFGALRIPFRPGAAQILLVQSGPVPKGGAWLKGEALYSEVRTLDDATLYWLKEIK